MRNWSVDEARLKKYPAKYAGFQLETLINYGLDGEKLDAGKLRRYLPTLDIPADKKAYLKHLLSLP